MIMNFEKRDDFAVIFEFIVIVFFEIFDVMKNVIDKSIWLFLFRQNVVLTFYHDANVHVYKICYLML